MNLRSTLSLSACLAACAPSPAPRPPEPAVTTPSEAAAAPAEPVLSNMSVAPAPSAPVTTPVLAPPDEARSVHPGINRPYRAPNAGNRWARTFERDGREVHDHRAEIVRALGLRPGMAVADIGAGTGLFTLAFADAVGTGGTVYAVDLIPEFLAHIRAKLDRAGVRQVRLVQATDRSAELPPASVDLLFMSDAYHHLEYPQHVLASLRRALRPGGSLWLIDFKREADRPEWLRKHVRAGKAVVLQELAQAGFELVEEPPLLRENYVLHLRARAP